MDGVYAKTFTGTVKPARVAFGNNMIPKGALVEIDVIAVCRRTDATFAPPSAHGCACRFAQR